MYTQSDAQELEAEVGQVDVARQPHTRALHHIFSDLLCQERDEYAWHRERRHAVFISMIMLAVVGLLGHLTACSVIVFALLKSSGTFILLLFLSLADSLVVVVQTVDAHLNSVLADSHVTKALSSPTSTHPSATPQMPPRHNSTRSDIGVDVGVNVDVDVDVGVTTAATGTGMSRSRFISPLRQDAAEFSRLRNSDDWSCAVEKFAWHFALQLSAWLIMALSVDRYITLRHFALKRQRRFMLRRAWIIGGVIPALLMLANLPYLVFVRSTRVQMPCQVLRELISAIKAFSFDRDFWEYTQVPSWTA
ncbi:unnamed protein product [Protopolystoma xenopodis]|uniref:G-protein coupled receptors family 1 profile domain-containing protein n=1 Tax=Protopolystoma xenopodis TaxID=117903 RepID=A0A448X954_9PLAT|nr:unnamed protein product [Protopolystoma xenopodis]